MDGTATCLHISETFSEVAMALSITSIEGSCKAICNTACLGGVEYIDDNSCHRLRFTSSALVGWCPKGIPGQP